MSSVAIKAHPRGAILPIRAHAGARHNGLRGQHAGSLQVSVTQAPEGGKANKALVAVLAQTLGLRNHQFELLAGATSSQKKFLVADITPDALAARVAEALAELDTAG